MVRGGGGMLMGKEHFSIQRILPILLWSSRYRLWPITATHDKEVEQQLIKQLAACDPNNETNKAASAKAEAQGWEWLGVVYFLYSLFSIILNGKRTIEEYIQQATRQPSGTNALQLTTWGRNKGLKA